MYIIGVILLFILPLAAGCACKGILRWKETNQIETYLIGFFFLFFSQSFIFIPAVFAKMDFQLAIMGILGLQILLAAVAFLFFILNMKKEQAQESSRSVYAKKDKFYIITSVVIFGANILRMVLSNRILREDMMLESVKTTVTTQTMFEYHPLTGCLMEAGMINSKKIVTLPLFYSSFVSSTGIDAQIFLNAVVGAMVLLAAMFSAALVYMRVSSVNRRKLFLFWSVYGLLILSGDYHLTTLSYRIMRQGYLGETICFAVILPYLLYVLISWYQAESGETKLTLGSRVQYILKMLLALGTSFVITGLGTGSVLLVLCLLIAAACCLVKSVKEVWACKE